MKINKDYFIISKKIENIRYFLSQGNLYKHLLDRFYWYLCPRLKWTSHFPKHIDIETSSACQMKCPMCARHLMDNILTGNMDFDLYKRIVDECTREKVYSIKLSWRGEPLLNPKIVEMVTYAKKMGIPNVAFLSNGEPLNNEIIEDLIDAGLDWISFSFDGLGETYERIRYPAKFEDTVEKILYMKKVREQKRLKKPLIRVQSIWSAIKDNPEEYKMFWQGKADRVAFISDQLRTGNMKDFQHDPNYICPSPWQRMCVAWDGKVTQCHADYMEGFILGDVTKKSLHGIWHDKPFTILREKMKNKKRLAFAPCRVCCDGGVPEKKTVTIGGKNKKVLQYVGQELDVADMETRKTP